MRPLKILALALLAGAVSGVPNPKQGRIIGGEPTSVEEYPTIVQVEYLLSFSLLWDQRCAASILNIRHVLSAAHCFSGNFYWGPEYRRIRAGATYRQSGGVIIYVEREINHPSYGLHGLDGDINVVRLSSPIVYSPVIQRASIPVQGTVIPDNLPVVHAGWGTIYENGPNSPVLLDVQIYTINNRLCSERYESLTETLPVTENMICAGLLGVGGKDACGGDSGGPLYYDQIVIGIISWGYYCGNETFPGVSTAVAPYTDWVVSNAV